MLAFDPPWLLFSLEQLPLTFVNAFSTTVTKNKTCNWHRNLYKSASIDILGQLQLKKMKLYIQNHISVFTIITLKT
jgi:hypothetical protein